MKRIIITVVIKLNSVSIFWSVESSTKLWNWEKAVGGVSLVRSAGNISESRQLAVLAVLAEEGEGESERNFQSIFWIFMGSLMIGWHKDKNTKYNNVTEDLEIKKKKENEKKYDNKYEQYNKNRNESNKKNKTLPEEVKGT